MIDLAFAMAPPSDGGGQGGAMGLIASLAPFLIIFAIFYFLLIRPQQKKAKENREMLAKLKKGDRVMTTGGILGTLTAVGEHTVTIQIAENVKIRVERSHIAELREGAEE
ncbi:MAG: preprotein translocase subunit YajC [Nitrospirae bacterium]|nr:preprotein translocase subunit YajC [Nitrospirota bacterium]